MTFREHAYQTLEYSTFGWILKKQLLYEENQKSGNVMQQPMDSCVCGINTISESILIRSYFTVRAINMFLSKSGTHVLREM